jgi:cell filamentation protein
MAKVGERFPDPHFNYKYGILKNIPDYTDRGVLGKFERIQSTKAIINLRMDPVVGHFDAAHVRKIHARIFKNIYPWAGEFRFVNIRRSASYFFALVQFMEANLVRTFAELAAEKHLKGLSADAFASRAAHYQGELNSIHPFREGNGRTQREFIRQLAAEAGHRMNWNCVTREQMVDASIESHNFGRNSAFAALIASAIVPIRRH